MPLSKQVVGACALINSYAYPLIGIYCFHLGFFERHHPYRTSNRGRPPVVGVHEIYGWVVVEQYACDISNDIGMLPRSPSFAIPFSVMSRGLIEGNIFSLDMDRRPSYVGRTATKGTGLVF